MNNFNKQNAIIPDSVYTICGEQTQDCTICSNNVYSPVVNGYVHDPLNGKVFCPFGKGESMNQSIMADQSFMNSFNINNFVNFPKTTWGRAPQMDPRPLSKIGLTWITS